MSSPILEVGEIDEDSGGPPALKVINDAHRLTVTFHTETGKITTIKDQQGLRELTGGVVCSTAHYYSPADSFSWACEVGTNGLVMLIAAATDPKSRRIHEEKWTVTLADGMATAFEKA